MLLPLYFSCLYKILVSESTRAPYTHTPILSEGRFLNTATAFADHSEHPPHEYTPVGAGAGAHPSPCTNMDLPWPKSPTSLPTSVVMQKSQAVLQGFPWNLHLGAGPALPCLEPLWIMPRQCWRQAEAVPTAWHGTASPKPSPLQNSWPLPPLPI